MALKSTLRDRDASPNSRLFEKSKAENAEHDQIDRDDDVEQARDDENENAGDDCDDGLQVSDADDHDGVPFGCT